MEPVVRTSIFGAAPEFQDDAFSTTSDAESADERVRNLLLAVPKKGRLHEKVMNLLKNTGFQYHRPDRLDIAHCTNMACTLVFLPASDIAAYVGEGNVDMGITGEDVIAETQTEVVMQQQIGMGKCKLCVLAPVVSGITDPASLAGKRIVTSFPNIAKEYFAKLETEATGPTSIKFVSGSVEAACGLGLADAVVDLVETGTTMRAAGLGVVSTIMDTQTVLISNPHARHPDLVTKINKRFEGYLTATKHCFLTYNVERAHLPAALKITPGKRSPSISPLDDGEWVAINVMVPIGTVADIMDELEQVGATDILMFNIQNFRQGHGHGKVPSTERRPSAASPSPQ